MKNICIIPARGGSKRIPRKNIKDFCGKPVIAYSIDIALRSNLFNEVMVSTDDPEIADIARSYGASVPFFRTPKNSDDLASTADVIEEVLNEYKQMEIVYDYFCCIYPTAPLIQHETLTKAFNKLVTGNFTTVFPVVEFSYPPMRGLIMDDNKVKLKFPEYLNSRSQDLEKMYHDVGQFYWGNVSEFLIAKKLFSSNSSFIKIDGILAQDIDTLDDWRIAEFKFKLLKNENII